MLNRYSADRRSKQDECGRPNDTSLMDESQRRRRRNLFYLLHVVYFCRRRDYLQRLEYLRTFMSSLRLRFIALLTSRCYCKQ